MLLSFGKRHHVPAHIRMGGQDFCLCLPYFEGPECDQYLVFSVSLEHNGLQVSVAGGKASLWKSLVKPGFVGPEWQLSYRVHIEIWSQCTFFLRCQEELIARIWRPQCWWSVARASLHTQSRELACSGQCFICKDPVKQATWLLSPPLQLGYVLGRSPVSIFITQLYTTSSLNCLTGQHRYYQL